MARPRFGSRLKKVLAKKRPKRVAKCCHGQEPDSVTIQSLVVDPPAVSELTLSVDQVPSDLDGIPKSGDEDENSSLEVMASPSASSQKDDVAAISASWIDPEENDSDEGTSFEWDDDAYEYVSSFSPRLHDYGSTISRKTNDSSIPMKKAQSDLRVRFSSPISTSRSFDALSAPMEQESPTRASAFKARIMSPMRAIESIYNSASSNGAFSPVGAMAGLDTTGIWLRDTAESSSKTPTLEVDVGAKVDDAVDASKVDDEIEELLRITFTPSEDMDDLLDCESPRASENNVQDAFDCNSPANSEGSERSEDPFSCESPVPAQPTQMESKGDIEACWVPSLSPAKYSMKPPALKLYPQNQWSPFYKVLTVLLAISCLSGHANQVLDRFDIPRTIVGLLHPKLGLEQRRSLRRRRYQREHDKFESPGRFLDARQNNVGVWLA